MCQLSYLPAPLWEEFYYIVHSSNLSGIARHGLMSYNEVARKGILRTDISNLDVQERRDSRTDPVHHLPLHDYVPLYVNPKNPMLYATRERGHELAILRVSRLVLEKRKHLFTDGNAACANTEFSTDQSVGRSSLDPLIKYWPDYGAEGKRRRMAEVLVYPDVPLDCVCGALVKDGAMVPVVQKAIGGVVEVSASTFF